MKTIKKLQIIVIVFVLLAANYAFAGGNVDVTKSTVHWKGAKVTGEHYGTISIKEGELSLNDGEIKGGKIVMDMNSIVDLDLESKEWNEKLVGHLKSDDFFSVDTYPTATLVLTNVVKNGNNYSFTGDLTIKGITHPVSFDAKSSSNDGVLLVKGAITVDRSKYDVKFRSAKFFQDLGDKLIYDDFTLDFELVVNE